MVWLSAGAVVVAVGTLVLLLALLAVRGLAYFWPQPLLMIEPASADRTQQLGVVLVREQVPRAQLLDAGVHLLRDRDTYRRLLLERGAAEYVDASLSWWRDDEISARSYPEKAVIIERAGAGPLYGFLVSLHEGDRRRALGAASIREQLVLVERARRQETAAAGAYTLRLASGRTLRLPLGDVLSVHAPNAMSLPQRVAFGLREIGRYLGESPRQVNTRGGVFPAIVGTVVLVVLMSVMVTPIGVLAAIYLQEYAHRGVITRLVRIAVNNLAGVPSIVYGVFGLGFFVYSVGGSLDALFFADRLPAPTLGTPGLLWASLTMALLTLPVVVVATEEGLARVPQSLREGSMALGATRAETLWRVVLPAASPALLTGLILAVARATGEVAPLILVGVAKYAPVLPVSTEFPWLHLDRQFMHLGFHIYDLGFQSPQLEAATGRVFATALLLVLIVVALNLSAVMLRSRLREAFKPQDLL
jgi:phosphate transport system permease protein